MQFVIVHPRVLRVCLVSNPRYVSNLVAHDWFNILINFSETIYSNRQFVERGSSAVECQTLDRGSPGSNPLGMAYCLEARAFSLT